MATQNHELKALEVTRSIPKGDVQEPLWPVEKMKTEKKRCCQKEKPLRKERKEEKKVGHDQGREIKDVLKLTNTEMWKVYQD